MCVVHHNGVAEGRQAGPVLGCAVLSVLVPPVLWSHSLTALSLSLASLKSVCLVTTFLTSCVLVPRVLVPSLTRTCRTHASFLCLPWLLLATGLTAGAIAIVDTDIGTVSEGMRRMQRHGVSAVVHT